ncbi:unnamed protein product [Prunus brigantina]
MMIDDKEPLMNGVKHALQREWQNIVHSDDVRIAWASPNVYTITLHTEVVAKKLMEWGPWFVHDDVLDSGPRNSSRSLDEK